MVTTAELTTILEKDVFADYVQQDALAVLLPKSIDQIPHQLKELVLEKQMQDKILQVEAPTVRESRRQVRQSFV